MYRVYHTSKKQNDKFIIDNHGVILEELNVKSIRQAESEEEIILDLLKDFKIYNNDLIELE